MKQQQELLLLLLLCHKLLLYNSCKISHDVNVVLLCWYNISLQSWYTPPLMYMHVVLIPVNRTISWKNKNRSCCIARIYCALLVRSFFIQRLHWGKGNNNSCVPKLHWGMNPPTLMSNTLKPGVKSANNYKQGYVQTHRHMTMVTHTFCMGQYGLAKKKEAGYITNNYPPLETPAGLFYFMSICVDVLYQNWCGIIFQPTVTILITVLDWFLYIWVILENRGKLQLHPKLWWVGMMMLPIHK